MIAAISIAFVLGLIVGACGLLVLSLLITASAHTERMFTEQDAPDKLEPEEVLS